jgi:hypothetical protein
VLYFVALVLLAVLFSVLGAVHLLGPALWVAGGLVGAFVVVGGIATWRIEVAKRRQRLAGLPVLGAWALDHDWSVDRREPDWVRRHDWLPHADPGPYLVVSGRMQGLPVEVVDVPWTEPDTDDDEDGPATGTHHAVAVHLPRRWPRGSVDGATLGRLRAHDLLSWDIADDLVVARVRVLDFEVYPDRITPAVELVLRVLEQRFGH